MKTTFSALLLSLICLSHAAQAHDTWVEANTNTVRTGDAVYIDLKLGNHGNSHRDFKLASKISLEKVTSLEIVAPDGSQIDLKESLIDTGYAPKEGYWSAKYVPEQSGLHLVAHTLDTLHHTTRAVKSAKTYFLAENGSAKASANVQKPLGHPLELILHSEPIKPTGPNIPIRVQLLFKDKPLAHATVTFIPRGQELEPGFDSRFERKTDAEGMAEFTPESGNRYLVVVHHTAPHEKGDGYERTAYSATLTLLIPERLFE